MAVQSFILGDTLEDALERADAYVEAGADGVMIHSKDKSGEDIKSFCLNFREKNTRTPIVVVPSSYNHIKEEELIKWGVNSTATKVDNELAQPIIDALES